MQDRLSVGHLQRAQVGLDAVLSPDAVVEDLDVQLSHPAQDDLRTENLQLPEEEKRSQTGIQRRFLPDQNQGPP